MQSWPWLFHQTQTFRCLFPLFYSHNVLVQRGLYSTRLQTLILSAMIGCKGFKPLLDSKNRTGSYWRTAQSKNRDCGRTKAGEIFSMCHRPEPSLLQQLVVYWPLADGNLVPCGYQLLRQCLRLSWVSLSKDRHKILLIIWKSTSNCSGKM